MTVGEDGGFAWLEADPTTPALAARLAVEGVHLAAGQVTELCLDIDPWLAGATAHLERGVVVLVDYALEPADLHSPARPGGTLRTFARHAVGGDPFRHVGRQDLTATVDLASVRAAAAAAGLDPLGETTQAELLARAGTSRPRRCLPASARVPRSRMRSTCARPLPASSIRAAWAASGSWPSAAACRPARGCGRWNGSTHPGR